MTSVARCWASPIELLTQDHQNKPDIAATKAREWIDTQNLSMLFGGTNSGVALAIGQGGQEKKRVYFNSGAGASALTNEQCTPYTVHYAYDTVALAKGTGGAVVKNGGKELVLPDGRLRLWPLAGGRYCQGREGQAAARCWATCAIRLNASDFSSLLAAGAKLQGPNPGLGQRRVATPSTPSRRHASLASTKA